MKLVKELKFKAIIDKDFERPFEVEKDGLYLLEISARCKNWRQNWGRLFDDDDLTISLDNQDLSGVTGRRAFEKPKAGWNGNQLKNLSQINVFVIRLKAGEHKLFFKPDQSPKLEFLRIYQITNPSKVEFVTQSPNNQAEDGNLRPWYIFALIDLALENLTIAAKASSGRQHTLFQSDDDDLQIKINGKRQRNDAPKSHHYWFWCGKVLKGESRTFEKDLNLPSGTRYIELLADRTPTLGKVVFSLKGVLPVGKVKLYKDVTAAAWVHLRAKASDADDSEILAKLYDGDEVEVIEERVRGSYIPEESDIWHRVNYKGRTGYILSSFVEIEGQERDVVIRKIRRKAANLEADVNNMLALAGCESQYKPYAVSEVGAKGVFQLTKDAKDQVEKGGFKVEDDFNIDQNIEGGIRYFLWLLRTYYESVPQSIEKTVAAYNWGQDNVLADKPLVLKDLPKQTANLVACVLENKERRNWKQIFLPLLIFLFGFAVGNGYSYLNWIDFFEPTVPGVLSSETEDPVLRTFFTRGSFMTPLNKVFSLDLDNSGSKEILKIEEQGNEIVDREIFFFQENGRERTANRVNKDPFFGNVATLAVWKPSKGWDKQVLVVKALSGQSVFMQLFLSEQDRLIPVPIEADGRTIYTIGTAGGIYFIDFPMPSEGRMILLTYRDYPPGNCRGQGVIYKFYVDRLVKVWDLDESLDWCRIFRG